MAQPRLSLRGHGWAFSRRVLQAALQAAPALVGVNAEVTNRSIIARACRSVVYQKIVYWVSISTPRSASSDVDFDTPRRRYTGTPLGVRSPVSSIHCSSRKFLNSALALRGMIFIS